MRTSLASGLAVIMGTLLASGSSAFGQSVTASDEQTRVAVSADQLLALGDRARGSGDIATAEAVYRALIADPSVEARSEARFRLAMMLAGLQRLPESAILLRQILDEQPNAQRVRLELAHVLDLMGDESGARRALREAQAGGLPPDVARLVDRYSAALRAQKPLGASIDIALAPDSNINRATRSDTLGTVLGDFVLEEDARQRSGLGLALRGQGYGRLSLSNQVNMFGRISASADLYRASEFNDLALAIGIGPELRIGADRLSFEAGGLWRWFGGNAYSRAATTGVNYFHPIGRKSQLRVTANVAFLDNRLNPLQDGQTFSVSAGYERALSSRAGVGITLSGDRQALRDPGY
jgi:tetratricopeptide (TPR) repeat protein